jgi:hypothetical protein
MGAGEQVVDMYMSDDVYLGVLFLPHGGERGGPRPCQHMVVIKVIVKQKLPRI